MAGHIILVQKKITLTYTSLAGGATYEYIHVPALNVVHARELIMNVRLLQKNIGTSAVATVFARGFYPDPEDGELVGADFLTVPLASVSVGINTATQVNNIPAWIRVGTKFTQPGTAVALVATYGVEIVARE